LKFEITIPSENGTPIKVRKAAVKIIKGASIISLLSASLGIVSSLVSSFKASAIVCPIPPQNFFPPLNPKMPTSIGPNLSCINTETFRSK
jgi:hypothetical protein